MPDYTFDPETGQYRDAGGQPLSRKELIALSETQIGDTDAEIAAATEVYLAGEISQDEWQAKLRDAILAGFVLQFMLGRGGAAQMTDADWEALGVAVQAQYDYLDGFAGDLEMLSAAETSARAGLYGQAQYKALWLGLGALMTAAGMTEERRRLGRAEHCDDCVALAALGWQPLGSLPEPGDASQCRANCRCTKEYRIAE